MRTVWRYSLEYNPPITKIEVPVGARPLFVNLQNGMPQLWMEINLTEDMETDREVRTFQFIGTGHSVPVNGRYLGTVLMLADTLVLHLYEVTS